MTDIALLPQNGDFSADISLILAGLATDDGLRTAVIISLFSDARAADDDPLPHHDADRRGWWGDAYAEIPGDVTGSKLWLLSRAKQLPATLTSAETYARASLAWLIADGVASAVSVVASFPNRGWLGLAIDIARPNGPARQHFDFVWRVT